MDITLRELNELKLTLIEGVTDNIFDDGSDNNDFLQNEAYNREVELINKVGEKLSKVDSIEGYTIKGKNSLWHSCWEYKCSMTPENEYSHHMQYIDALIGTFELITKDKINISLEELLLLKKELEDGVAVVELIEKISDKLEKIDSVEGHRHEDRDRLWYSLYEYNATWTPMVKYNHHIKYIDLLISTVGLSKA